MLQTVSERSIRENQRLIERLEQAWRFSDRLFGIVRPRSLHERPIDQRHPVQFYIGHLPAFAWNMLGRGVLQRESPRPEFDGLFDFGIDPEEGEEPPEPTWPPLEEVFAYRDAVRAAIRDSAEDVARRAESHPLAEGGRGYQLVLEHELMHHETLLYMFQELDQSHKRRPDWWLDHVKGSARVDPHLVPVSAGAVTLGVDNGDVPFAWDNEFPGRTFDVPAFELAAVPVTIGEFAEFIDEAGYDAEELWLPEDWQWRRRCGIEEPKAWVVRGGRRYVRTMFERLPLEEVSGWPASVSLAEARAFARWKGMRLPSEPELRRAASGAPPGTLPPRPSDEEHRQGNFGLRNSGPVPVGSFDKGASLFGVHDLRGNGWDWTSTVFEEHEGFEITVDEYAGYSRDFFDGSHFVLLGGSWATPEPLLRRSFRNWFRHNYPYPFTQFRLAR